MAKKAPAFEKQLERLEEIVRLLENGDLPLEDSLRSFEEGVKLARGCHERLGEAERRVELLLEEAGGDLRTQPFAEEDDGDEDEFQDEDTEDEGILDQG